jgi:probable HAF family extracellular repeat protein
MKPHINPLSVGLVCTLAALALSLSTDTWAATQAEYTVTELKTLPGTLEPSRPVKINDAGVILANSYDSLYHSHAFVYENGTLRELDKGNGYVVGHDINNAGQVIGTVKGLGPVEDATLFYPDGTMLNLSQALGQWVNPIKMNDRGDILESYTLGFIIYNPSTGMIRPWEDPFKATPFGINNRGEIVGYSGEMGGTLFNEHTYIHFQFPGSFGTSPTLINNHGLVAGYAVLRDPVLGHPIWRPFLYQHGRFTDLGTLPGDESAYAFGINDLGDVTGASAHSTEGGGRAFIFRKSEMVDLNTLIPEDSGWFLGGAGSINNHGQILAAGKFHGEYRSCLLTPIKLGKGEGKSVR